MIRLIYVSKALQRLPLDLKEILAVSMTNNAQKGITGALCVLNGVYLQYLEGEAIARRRCWRSCHHHRFPAS